MDDHSHEGGRDDGSREVDRGYAPEGHAAPGGLALAANGLRFEPSTPRFDPGTSTGWTFRIVDEDGEVVTDFEEAHGERSHLIVVRRDLTRFQHLHPDLEPDGTWRVEGLALPDPGAYRAFVDVVVDGHSTTLGFDLFASGCGDVEARPDSSRRATVGDYEIDLLADDGDDSRAENESRSENDSHPANESHAGNESHAANESHDGHDDGHDHGGTVDGPVDLAEVTMASTGDGHHFEPHVVWVTGGGTVRWTLESGAHSTTAYHPDNDRPRLAPEGAQSWDSGTLTEVGAEFEHTFDTEGVYHYYCIPHESLGMIGSVIVGQPDPHDQPALREPPAELSETTREKIEELNATCNEALGHTH